MSKWQSVGRTFPAEHHHRRKETSRKGYRDIKRNPSLMETYPFQHLL